MISKTDSSIDIEVVKKVTYVYLISYKVILSSAFPSPSYLMSE